MAWRVPHRLATPAPRTRPGSGRIQATGWNFQDPALSKPSELAAQRPSLLRDYLDDQHAADIEIHLRQNLLLLIQADRCDSARRMRC
jgi:hypothetical protein